MMGRLRREALQTLYESRQMIADGKRQLGKSDVVLDRLDLLIDIGLGLLERFEKHGLDVNPKVGDTEIPVGVNVSVPENEGEK